MHTICYQSGGPPDLPLAVIVRFDSYSGSTLHDGSVPITPLRCTWSTIVLLAPVCSSLLALAWAVTIHEAQGLTLNKAVVDVGTKEFSTGLMFVACSRVRHLSDLAFVQPFDYQHLSNLANSCHLIERRQEDTRLHLMQEAAFPSSISNSPSLLTSLPPSDSSSSAAPSLLPSIEHGSTGTPAPTDCPSPPSPSDSSPSLS